MQIIFFCTKVIHDIYYFFAETFSTKKKINFIKKRKTKCRQEIYISKEEHG